MRQNFLRDGVINFWNSLPDYVVLVPASSLKLKCFKNRFDKHCVLHIALKFSSTLQSCTLKTSQLVYGILNTEEDDGDDYAASILHFNEIVDILDVVTKFIHRDKFIVLSENQYIYNIEI